MTDLKPEDLERVERLLARAIVAANSSEPVETHLGLACEFIGAREDFLSLLADRARMEKVLRAAAVYLDALGENLLRNDADMMLDECRDPKDVAEGIRQALGASQ